MKSRFILLPTSEALIDQFVKSLTAKGKAESTSSHYRSILTAYMSYTERKDVDPFSHGAVNGYLSDKRMCGCNSSTLRSQYFILKCFFEGTGHEKDWTFNKNDAPPKLDERFEFKPVLDQSEMNRLEEAARGRGFKNRRPFTNLRNYAIIRLSNELGLKLVEIANIDFGDVHLTPEDEYPMDRLQTLTGEEMEYLRTTYFHPHVHLKTGKREQVVRGISPETIRVLQEYIQTRLRNRMRLGKWKYGDELALFVTRSGERVTRHALSELHLEVRKAAGIKKRRGGFEASRRGRII